MAPVGSSQHLDDFRVWSLLCEPQRTGWGSTEEIRSEVLRITHLVFDSYSKMVSSVGASEEKDQGDDSERKHSSRVCLQ